MTPKPTEVRLARAGDEDPLFALARAGDTEWSMGARSDAKVKSVIAAALFSDEHPRPVFGIIPGPMEIEGAVGIYPTEPWNSSDLYLRVFFHFVHPHYRRSTHAVRLTDFAKWFGDVSGLPVVFELLHPERTEAKARLYARRAKPIGGLFIHDVARRGAEIAA